MLNICPNIIIHLPLSAAIRLFVNLTFIKLIKHRSRLIPHKALNDLTSPIDNYCLYFTKSSTIRTLFYISPYFIPNIRLVSPLNDDYRSYFVESNEEVFHDI